MHFNEYYNILAHDACMCLYIINSQNINYFVNTFIYEQHYYVDQVGTKATSWVVRSSPLHSKTLDNCLELQQAVCAISDVGLELFLLYNL